MWVWSILNAFIFVIVVRFMSAVLGFGFQQALFGGKFSFPWDAFCTWVGIHTVSCLIAHHLFPNKELNNNKFNLVTALLDIVIFIIIVVVVILSSWGLK